MLIRIDSKTHRGTVKRAAHRLERVKKAEQAPATQPSFLTRTQRQGILPIPQAPREDAPFLEKYIRNTGRDVATAVNRPFQAAARNYGPVPEKSYKFTLNPFAQGSAGTYRDIGRSAHATVSPAAREALRAENALKLEQQAGARVQRRMQGVRKMLAGPREDIDFGSVTGRMRAAPSYIYDNPVFNKREMPTVAGMDPSTIASLANFAGGMFGAPKLLPTIDSRMSGLYPAGGAAATDLMTQMGLREYINLVTGGQNSGG
jgi:hypothetical protein